MINKKNRTTCKACRLKKCLMVGMSKSGSRYGRRSNWFKIHCLLQEQQHHQQRQQQHYPPSLLTQPLLHSQLKAMSPPLGMHVGQRKDELLMLGIDDYKISTSPSISSPESQNSDSSIEMSERRAAYSEHPGYRQLHSHLQTSAADLSNLSKDMITNMPLGFHVGGMSLLPPAFLPPPNLNMFPPYHMYPPHNNPHPLVHGHPASLMHHSTIIDDISSAYTAATATTNTVFEVDNKESYEYNNNNDSYAHDQNESSTLRCSSPNPETDDACTKRFYLDAVLKSQQLNPESPGSAKDSEDDSPSCSFDLEADSPPPQDNPMDLSMKQILCPAKEEDTDEDDEEEMEGISDTGSPPRQNKPAPMDLTTKS